MRAMVTGGAGFIGSHIIESLLKDGHEVVSIDNYSAGKRENLSSLACENLKEVNCDVTDYGELKKYMSGIDVIFHEAASKKNICLKDPRRDLEVNGKGTFNILELARDFKVKKVVHASTGSVYGEAVILPQDENHPLNPVSYYGVSKLAGERYALAFSKLYDMDVTVLRYFHVYGERQDSSEFGGVIPIFIRKILNKEPMVIYGDGRQERSFTYVGDIVKINRLVAERPETKGEVYNCASGENVTVRQMAGMLPELLKTPARLKYDNWLVGDIKKFQIDNSKVKKLGIEFTPFKEGLKRTVESYKYKSPFHTKDYGNYDEYTKHQKSKLDDNLTERKWFKKYNIDYKKFLTMLLKKFVDVKGKSSLCIGARTGTEVQSFIDLGSFSVGIDLNTGKDNKYVVTGDASAIQYPDSSIDIVYTNALDHFLKIEESISEIKRVLKPDGFFVFLIGTPEDAKKDKWGSTYWDGVKEVIEYLVRKYGFKFIGAADVKKTGWFSDFVVMKR